MRVTFNRTVITSRARRRRSFLEGREYHLDRSEAAEHITAGAAICTDPDAEPVQPAEPETPAEPAHDDVEPVEPEPVEE